MSSASIIKLQDALARTSNLLIGNGNALRAIALGRVKKSGETVVDAHKNLGRVQLVSSFVQGALNLFAGTRSTQNSREFFQGLGTVAGKAGEIKMTFDRGTLTSAEHVHQLTFQVDYRAVEDDLQAERKRASDFMQRVPGLLQLIDTVR